MENNKDRSAYGAGLVLLSTLMFGSYGVWSRLIGDAMGNFFQATRPTGAASNGTASWWPAPASSPGSTG